MTQGETRMVMTERARGAVLQRSQSGNTIVASDLTAALDAVRNHPKDGVVWQTSDEPPSAYLLKVSGGSLRREEEGLAQRINAKESDILLSAKAERNETASETVDLKAAPLRKKQDASNRSLLSVRHCYRRMRQKMWRRNSCIQIRMLFTFGLICSRTVMVLNP
jgi:hypothetical protein